MKGQKVTSIGSKAFANKKLTSVKLPKSIKEIEDVAFLGNALKSITIPEGVTTIGMGSFMKNELVTLNIPDSVTSIGPRAFMNNKLISIKLSKNIETIDAYVFNINKLSNVTIHDGIKNIRGNAFSNNKLQDVVIPSTVETIEAKAFDGNKDIKLTYSKLVEAIKGAQKIKTEGKEEDKVKVLKESIEAGNNLNKNSNATLQEVNKVVGDINNAIKDLNGEVSIETTIKSVKPLGVENISVDFGTSEDDAKAKLPKKAIIVDSKDQDHNVDITWSISKYNGSIQGEYIATGTFKLPEGVAQPNPQIDLKATVKITVKSKAVEYKNWEIKDFTFNGAAITGFSESGKEKFKENKDLILPKTNAVGEEVSEISDKAFYSEIDLKGNSNNSFKDRDKAKQDPKIGINSVSIPDTVKIIGAEAFRNNCLTDIHIPKSVTTIKKLAFNNNKLKSLIIPDSVTVLENGSFTLNNIADLKLSKGLKTIPVAFGYNNLVTVTIPEGVTRIDDMAFSDNQLAEVKLPSTLEYLSGFNNNNFTSINIPKNVKELGKKAFARNKIASVTIPGNVKVVGVSAFQNTWHDTFITSINIEEGVEKIEGYAFSLNHLKDVQLPSTVKELDPNAFHNNLGYDGVVHLFTPEHKNLNNLKESKDFVINPAKLTIKYVFEDRTLKEEEMWKNKTTGEYLHIGDNDIEITPKYEDNEYELEKTDIVKVVLNNKDNKLIIKCKKKAVAEKLEIKSIGKVAPLVVDFQTEKNVVMSTLPSKTYIIDSNGEKHEVQLNWTLKDYDGNKSGEYTAVGTFKLPQDVSQSEPEMKLEVVEKIIVKEKFGDIEDSKWETKDFTFEGTTVIGFSEEGEEKLKTNKDLVLPKVNDKGESIAKVKNYAFRKKGLTSLTIPEGLNELVIGTNAFEQNQINKIYIPEGVKEIDAFAFEGNKLKYVNFPGTLKKIGNNAFANNELVSAIFSEYINDIALDRFSFYNNKLTSVTILNKVKKVHEEAFKDNKEYSSDDKVNIYTLNLDAENCNQWFPNSEYHKVIVLAVESIKEIKPIEVNLGTEKNDIKSPDKITLNLNNGTKKDVNVKWSSEEYNSNKPGEYIFKAAYDLPEGITSKKPDVILKVLVK
ncbi:leucine-rich repeat protein [Clostridium sporogenes]|nr:leucine-rich repeat protein [Clostridium sporogenes]